MANSNQNVAEEVINEFLQGVFSLRLRLKRLFEDCYKIK